MHGFEHIDGCGDPGLEEIEEAVSVHLEDSDSDSESDDEFGIGRDHRN